MTQIILIIIGIAVIVILLSRQTREKVIGICAAVLGQNVKKQENKKQILALLSEKGELSNSEIRETLGISDRSVVRYLDELEKEGKVEPLGRCATGVPV